MENRSLLGGDEVEADLGVGVGAEEVDGDDGTMLFALEDEVERLAEDGGESAAGDLGNLASVLRVPEGRFFG